MATPQRTVKPHQQRPGSRRTPLIVTTIDGMIAYDERREPEAATMFLPHCCMACGTVYDGGLVTVKARYADCDLWDAPCCGATHDSRPAWNGMPGHRQGYVDLAALRRGDR